MPNKTIRVVTRAADGGLQTDDFPSIDSLHKLYEQIGIDDCSTDLSLRGFPVFRGLIGPIPESKTMARYESPEVFESLTKEWATAAPKKRSRRRTPAKATAGTTTSA